MNKIYSHLDINLYAVNELNKFLLNIDMIKKLSSEEKMLLDNFKAEVSFNEYKIHHTDYYNRISDNKQFCSIDADSLNEYFIRMNIIRNLNPITKLNFGKSDLNIHEFMKNILNYIIDEKDKAILKNIKIFDNIFNKGIKLKQKDKTFKIYRVMKNELNCDTFKSYSSWSLIPIMFFCTTEICHLYITKIPHNIKFIYLDIKPDYKDKDLLISESYNQYEYEILFPRGIKIKELKQETLKIPPIQFNIKNNSFTEQTVIIHYIKIIGI